MKKIINVYSDRTNDVLFAAKDYRTAVQTLFGDKWISTKEEIQIDNEWSTLEEYFGEEVCDMMSDDWDIDDFNEFWESDFWMEEVDYID